LVGGLGRLRLDASQVNAHLQEDVGEGQLVQSQSFDSVQQPRADECIEVNDNDMPRKPKEPPGQFQMSSPSIVPPR
jgi:hypothetical protein